MTISTNKSDKTNRIPIPNRKEFLELGEKYIKEIIRNHQINTIYLPIDGTRRHFIDQTGIDYTDQNFYDEYFDFVIPETIKLLTQVYKLGIENIIVLLMDDTAFDRPVSYLKPAIERGIKPTATHRSFLEFYDRFNLSVYYGGFNTRYLDIGFDNLLEYFDDVTNRTKNDSINTLTYYTGTTCQNDYIEILRRYSEILISEDIDQNSTNIYDDEIKTKIIRDLYGHQIPSIDLTIYFGEPRDKIVPPLLWGEGYNEYTKKPTLSLERTDLLKIFHRALEFSEYSIQDRFVEYKR